MPQFYFKRRNEPPLPGEIASRLRHLGSIEGHDTIPKHGGYTYVLMNDGDVTCNGILVSSARSDLGGKHGQG